MMAASLPYRFCPSRHAGHRERYHGNARAKLPRDVFRDLHGDGGLGNKRRIAPLSSTYDTADISSRRVPIQTSMHTHDPIRHAYSRLTDFHSPLYLCRGRKRAGITSARMGTTKREGARFFKMCHQDVQELGGALHNLESVAFFLHLECSGTLHALTWNRCEIEENFTRTNIVLVGDSARIWLEKCPRHQVTSLTCSSVLLQCLTLVIYGCHARNYLPNFSAVDRSALVHMEEFVATRPLTNHFKGIASGTRCAWNPHQAAYAAHQSRR